MKRPIRLKLTVLFMFILGASCGTIHKPTKGTQIHHSGYEIPLNQSTFLKDIQEWPSKAKSVAFNMHDKYGLPDMASSEMLIWYDTAPFIRSVISRNPVEHSFPYPHSDVLQQTVAYRVPIDKLDLLTRFDGSLVVDRTKGELSARSDKEELNILLLNFADKIVKNKLTVDEARNAYSEIALAYATGTTHPLLQKLAFETKNDTQDLDAPLSHPGIQAQEEAREAVKEVEDIQN